MRPLILLLLFSASVFAQKPNPTPFKVFHSAGQIFIQGNDTQGSYPFSQTSVTQYPNNLIKLTYGANTIYLSPSNFRKANGFIWGQDADQAVSNYMADLNGMGMAMSVSRSADSTNIRGVVRIASMPSPQIISGDVNVKNLPSTQPVSVTNWPTTQTVNGSVNANVTFPVTQQVGGVVNVGNFPTNQNVTIQNPVTSLAVSNFPAKQAIEGGNTNAVNIAGAVTANVTFPATQNVNVVNPVTTVTANVQGGNSTAVKVDGSAVTQPVSGVFWPAVQPVSGAVSVSGPVAIQDTYQILPADTWQYSNASLAALSTVQIAPAVAGRRHYITGLQIYNLATLVLGTIEVLDGATVIARVQIPAAGGKEVVFPTPLRGSVNSAISVRPATASVALMVSAQGYLSNN